MIPPFQSFLDANRVTAYRFLVAAVGRQDADDVFQETFLAALRGYRRVTDELEAVVGARVDLVPAGQLKPAVRQRAERDLVAL